MSDNSEIKIHVIKNDLDIDIDKIDVDDDVDKIDVDKIDVDDDVDKIFTFDDQPHNGNPITRVEVSPNEKFLVTYSYFDSSIIGWNVEDLDKGQLKLDDTVQPVKVETEDTIFLCVSDDKKLVYNINRNYEYYDYDYDYGK